MGDRVDPITVSVIQHRVGGHRPGDGRGHAPDLVFPDPKLEPRLLDGALRCRGPTGRPGRARAHPRGSDPLGRPVRARVLRRSGSPGRRLPPERPVSRQQPPARPHRVRAGLRPRRPDVRPEAGRLLPARMDNRRARASPSGATGSCSGRSIARTRATSAARLTAPTIPARPRSGRKGSASRPSASTRREWCATTSSR